MLLLRNLTAAITLLVALGLSFPAAAASGEAADEQLVHSLLDTMARDDYDGFMSHVAPGFGQIAARDFRAIAAQIGPRLAGGYELEYFGMLHQLGVDISVWKISFSDSNGDVLATMNVQDGKVGGFYMQ